MKTNPAIFDELRSIQHRDGYVSSAAIDEISRKTNLPIYYIHGLASGFPQENFSAGELAEIQRLVDTATANLPGGSSIEIANERAELRASVDEAVTVAIEAAGES